MAANSMADEVTSARRRGPHPLALAYFAAFIGLALVFGAVAMYGRPSDGDPVVVLDIQAPPAAKTALHMPAAAKPSGGTSVSLAAPATQLPTAQNANVAPVALPPAIVPGTVSKPIVAGRSLIADPALIEQTPDGPLP